MEWKNKKQEGEKPSFKKHKKENKNRKEREKMGLLVALVFLIVMCPILILLIKKGSFSTQAESQISMRPGEASILSTKVVWMQKSVYLLKSQIPNGILDITNQRAVYTRTHGPKVSFALEKADILTVAPRGGVSVVIQTRDGRSITLNTVPAKNTLQAFEKMGVKVLS